MLIVSEKIIGVSFPTGRVSIGGRRVNISIDHYITHRGFRWQPTPVREVSTWDDYEDLPPFLQSSFLRQWTKHPTVFIDERGRVYSSTLHTKKSGSNVTDADIEAEVSLYPIRNGQIYVFDAMPMFAEQMAGFLAVEGLDDLKKIQDFTVHMGSDGREIVWITLEELTDRIKEKKKLFDAQMDKELKASLEKLADKYENPDDEEAPATPPKPKRRGRKPAATASSPAAPSEDTAPAPADKPKRKRRTALDCVRELGQPEPVGVAPEPRETQPIRRVRRRRGPVGV